jgi:hypothetical protein
MSTKFGVYKHGGEIALVNDQLPEGYNEDDFVLVAFRGNGGWIKWANDLAHLFPDETKVYPVCGNSAQGIYTIKDIKLEM